MKSKLIGVVSVALASALFALGEPASAQSSNSPIKTDTKMLYHNGPVVFGTPNVYVIFYGCWEIAGCGNLLTPYNDLATIGIITDFLSTLGGSPYFQINSGYPDSNGLFPSGGLIYGGYSIDRYSHGQSLSEADVGDIVANALNIGILPQDPSGIFLVITTADVTVDDTATHFCLTCCTFHRYVYFNGGNFPYAFVGNPSRCPSACSPQANSPNANYAADAMASWIANALSRIVTNPRGSGWYDRYGLENAEKCEGTYGQTYTVTNSDGKTAAANIKLGQRDFLLQQNWFNGRKAHCTMVNFQ